MVGTSSYKDEVSTKPGQAQTAETLALLKILKLGDRQIEAGQVQPAADVFARLRKRYQTD
ncbi:MAG: hypothetical protein OXH70_14265 [Acidobacteria bacterium]|nr:hypothetical protein [Acidobacteriota bacterium]